MLIVWHFYQLYLFCALCRAARPGKPNNLSGLPTSRRILKGELENAVDNLLNTGTLLHIFIYFSSR